LAELGVDLEFVQDNHSRSPQGIGRGIHRAAVANWTPARNPTDDVFGGFGLLPPE
jgi:hypothetical protein